MAEFVEYKVHELTTRYLAEKTDRGFWRVSAKHIQRRSLDGEEFEERKVEAIQLDEDIGYAYQKVTQELDEYMKLCNNDLFLTQPPLQGIRIDA